MKKERPSSVVGLLTQLVRQTREFYQWTARQMTGAATAPAPQPAAPSGPAEKITVIPEAKEDKPPTEGGPSDGLGRTSSTQGAPGPEMEGTDGSGATEGRNYKNRIDVAWSRRESQGENAGETQALLEQAVSLLETLSAHPAIRDYTETKRRLDDIEQRLGYGSYPQ